MLESRSEILIAIGRSALDLYATPGTGHEVRVHSRLLAEKQGGKLHTISACQTMEETNRHVALAALIGGKQFGSDIALPYNIIDTKVKSVAQSAQTRCNILYMIHNRIDSQSKNHKVKYFFEIYNLSVRQTERFE